MDLVHEQENFLCRLLWGHRGALQAVRRRDILVIVDVLSFSTTAVTAAARGVTIIPAEPDNGTQAFAQTRQALLAASREMTPRSGVFTLSPCSFLEAPAGLRVVLPSPNGAMCCRLAADLPSVMLGALVNARATGEALAQLQAATGLGISILACGERWQDDSVEGPLRFAVEDYLGAGAILSHLKLEKSPEAAVCEAAYRSAGNVQELVMRSTSGAELAARGYLADVLHACNLDAYDVAAALRKGEIQRIN